MSPRPSAPFGVLLVSRHNEERALLAERLLRPALATQGFEADAIRVTSAGLEPGAKRPSQPLKVALLGHGGSAGGFAPRVLDADIAAGADVVLTLTAAERDEVASRHPRVARHCFTLAEYVALADGVNPVPLSEHPEALAEARASELAPATADDSPGGAADFPDEVPADLPGWKSDAERISGLVAQLVALWIPIAPVSARVTPRYTPGRADVVVPLEALGVGIDVWCAGQGASALHRALTSAWSRCLREGGEATQAIHLVIDDDPIVRARAQAKGHVAYAHVSDAMHALASLVTVRAIDARAGELFMLHAAGLALEDGRVIAFVAPSGTGKTTLAATLGQSLGYVSDETVAVTLDGAVVPYPKPLSVVQPGTAVKDQRSPDELGLTVPTGDLRLAAVTILHRVKDGDVPAHVVEAPLFEAMVELAAQTSYLPRFDKPLATMARLLESVGGVRVVMYSDVADVPALLPQLVGEGAS